MTRDIVDGNDLLAVFNVVRGHRERITAAPEPVFIELKTYRLGGHSRGDQCLYRSRDEEARWQNKDPIARLRQLLTDQHGWTDAHDTAMEAEIGQELEAAEQFARETDE